MRNGPECSRTAGSHRGNSATEKRILQDLKIPGDIYEMNPELDKANRVADFIELGELMCIDALNRNESCGGHFREEMQTKKEKQNGMMNILVLFQPGNIKENTSGNCIRKN